MRPVPNTALSKVPDKDPSLRPGLSFDSSQKGIQNRKLDLVSTLLKYYVITSIFNNQTLHCQWSQAPPCGTIFAAKGILAVKFTAKQNLCHSSKLCSKKTLSRKISGVVANCVQCSYGNHTINNFSWTKKKGWKSLFFGITAKGSCCVSWLKYLQMP